MLTIRSKAELEFIAEHLYRSTEVLNEVWIGLRKKGDKFKWIDDSNLEYTNWAVDSPTNRTDYDCVQISSEIYQIGGSTNRVIEKIWLFVKNLQRLH
jgi:hypothetical protein